MNELNFILFRFENCFQNLLSFWLGNKKKNETKRKIEYTSVILSVRKTVEDS